MRDSVPHDWDYIRACPTEIEPSVYSCPVHESILRGYQILREVKRMLAAGDSSETIFAFVRWAEQENVTPTP